MGLALWVGVSVLGILFLAYHRWQGDESDTDDEGEWRYSVESTDD